MRRVALLLASGLALGALLTGAAGALPGSQDLSALSWLGTVSTVAALVVAVGIYRVQQAQSDAAHQELLDALKAQDEILETLSDSDSAGESDGSGEAEPAPAEPAPAEPTPAEPAPGEAVLTEAQRRAIEERYGEGTIEEAWAPGGHRGDGRARLVRLGDGTLLTVFDSGRGGDRVRVREVAQRGRHGRPAWEPRGRGRR